MCYNITKYCIFCTTGVRQLFVVAVIASIVRHRGGGLDLSEIIYVPEDRDGSTVISYTAPFKLDRKAKITVPHQYTALVFADGKLLLRMEPCDSKIIYRVCGKEQVGHTLQIAFVHGKAIPETLWGFGNVQVNNQRLRELYRAGANGACKVVIADISGYGRLAAAFPHGMTVTIDSIRERLNAIIGSVGVQVLGSCLANSPVSACEVSSLLGEVQNKMQVLLADNQKIKEMGLRISALTVVGLFVNWEDLESIRSRLNKPESTKEAVSPADGKSLAAGNVTAHASVEHQADDCADETLIMKAAVIQSNVEKNLITKFQLPHEGAHFVINYDEYLRMVEAMPPDVISLPNMKEKLHVLSSDGVGNPIKIEMFPLIRFVKAGLPIGEAKKATRIWKVLNCIRHRSPGNTEYLRKFFDAPGMTVEKFMSDALDFYHKNGLYTKD